MHRRMLLTERLLNKARRTARYKGYRRKRAFNLPREELYEMNYASFIYHRLCSKIHVKRMVKKIGVYDTVKTTIKDAVVVAQQSDNADLYRKVLDSYMAAVSLMEENIELKDKIRELERKMNEEENVILRGESYYRKLHDEKEDGPCCMQCWDNDKKLIHYALAGDLYYCPKCRFTTRMIK